MSGIIDIPFDLPHQAFHAAGISLSPQALPAVALAGAMVLAAGVAFGRSAAARLRGRAGFPASTQ